LGDGSATARIVDAPGEDITRSLPLILNDVDHQIGKEIFLQTKGKCVFKLNKARINCDCGLSSAAIMSAAANQLVQEFAPITADLLKRFLSS
jgi:hypothetical protein